MGGAPQVGAARLRDTVAMTALSVRGCASCLLINLLFLLLFLLFACHDFSGVGSNSDSFYEYLIKHYLLFPDDSDWWSMFVIAYGGVHDNSRLSEWYVDVDMSIGLLGQIRQVFESLMAFYPGMQVLLGELVPAAKSLNSFFLVREFMGLLPERFNFVKWRSVADGAGDVHPLRPELLESCYFLHLASIGLHGSKRGPASHANSAHHTSSWLWAADFALNGKYDIFFLVTLSSHNIERSLLMNFVDDACRGSLAPHRASYQ